MLQPWIAGRKNAIRERGGIDIVGRRPRLLLIYWCGGMARQFRRCGARNGVFMVPSRRFTNEVVAVVGRAGRIPRPVQRLLATSAAQRAPKNSQSPGTAGH